MYNTSVKSKIIVKRDYSNAKQIHSMKTLTLKSAESSPKNSNQFKSEPSPTSDMSIYEVIEWFLFLKRKSINCKAKIVVEHFACKLFIVQLTRTMLSLNCLQNPTTIVCFKINKRAFLL
jgi:hypothetical protein